MGEYPYGHDFGNGETDGIMFVNGQVLHRSMPTAEVVAPSDERMKNLGVELDKQTVLFRMWNESTAYMIGKGAIDLTRGGESHRGNISRYTGMSSVRALLANAASMIKDKAFQLRVVTGIPVETYAEDHSIRQHIIDALSGQYRFSLNGEERQVEIVAEKVVAEGAGAIIAYGTGGDTLQGVIDCGGRTLDLYVSRGQKPQLDMCKSFVLGVESAMDLLKANFYKKYRVQLSTADARSIMFAYTCTDRSVSYPSLAAKGRDVLVADQIALAEESIRVIGEQVTSKVASAWSEGETTDQVAASFKQVFFVGRGDLYFRKFIERIIAPEQFRLVEDPGGANAYGYATLARRLQIKSLNQVAS
jgi:hypothetical protein